jgi:aldose sugar dehydrogenase
MRLSLGAARLLIVFTMSVAPMSPGIAQKTYSTSAGSIVVETVAADLDHPWGLAFLPDGRMLVTERAGRLRLIGADGRTSAPIKGVPEVVAAGQGGLLDVVVDPDFATTRLIFFSFAEARVAGNGTSIARARLSTDLTTLEDMTVIFRQLPAYDGVLHFGSRIVFDRTGHMFITVGDRYVLRDEAQNGANTLGKIMRIDKSGAPAADNPKRADWVAHIWSIGHRNVQGAALHPVTGKLWTAEHGAKGGDEINVVEAGRNYGWPVITYGRDYSGAKIGIGTSKAGLEQPIHYWDPSIAPSGLTFYTGDKFADWRGSLFVGALAGQHIARLTLEGEKVVSEEKLLTDMARFRDVRQGADGFLYALTDAPWPDGRLLRIRPR